MSFNPLLNPRRSFPAEAKYGDIIFHVTFNEIFKCVNGHPADTTVKGNWKVIDKVRPQDIISEGVSKGKVLISDGLGATVFSDLDGGTLE